MTSESGTSAPGLAKEGRRLAVLLAMAMFVLVVWTAPVMNVSIASVVHDLHTTVSGVQSAIALEALVSAAFILIGSKVGDLIGRKRAYVLGAARLRDPGPTLREFGSRILHLLTGSARVILSLPPSLPAHDPVMTAVLSPTSG